MKPRWLFIQIVVSLLLFFSPWIYSQNEKDSLNIYFLPYTSLRGQGSIYNDKMEVQDNASHVGMSLEVKKENLTFLAVAEFQVNLFKGATSFNADANLAGGFIQLKSEQKNQVLGNRLGYVGIRFGKYGSITLGKQWSVYRDITSYSDKFSVFGGRGSATFVGGTDGGENGTGRADQTLIYRNKISLFQLGVQIQARGSNESTFIDGFGFSLQLEALKNCYIGLGFNKTLLSKRLLNDTNILGLKSSPTYLSLGMSYLRDNIELGIVGVLQENGDFLQGYYYHPNHGLLMPVVVFNAKGFEFFGKYKMKKLEFLAGVNLYVPNIRNIVSVDGYNAITNRFQNKDMIFGIVYKPMYLISIYSEQRISFGQNLFGVRDPSVFALGIRIDFSKNYKNVVVY